MEEEKKKVLVPIVVGVLTLLVLVIGATYAYFAVGINNNFGTTTISASADNVGTVTLTNINSTLSMSLTAADMMRSGTVRVCQKCMTYSGKDCTVYESCLEGTQDCECSGGYNNITYYATPSGKSTAENMAWEIGRATVSPNTDTNYYSCDYTLSVSNTGTTNMYTTFGNMTNKSLGQVVFQINDTTYDWYTNGMPNSYTGNMIVSVDNPGHITAGLKLVNQANIDQTDLAGTDIAITIQATNFSCTAIPVTRSYYNASNESNPVSTPGTMEHYIKATTVNSTTTTEVCGVFNSEACLKPNDWATAASYKTTFETAGATCNSTYETDEYLVCTLGSVYCDMAHGGGVSCGSSAGNCGINSNGIVECWG